MALDLERFLPPLGQVRRKAISTTAAVYESVDFTAVLE